MSGRLTRLNASALTLMGLALLLSVVSGHSQLVLVAAPLLGALAQAAFRPRRPSYALTHEVSVTRLFEGHCLTVTITLTATTPLAQVELLEPLPPAVELVKGANRAVFSLAQGQTVRWRYELRCMRRARFTLGTVHLRFWDRSGLRVIEAQCRDLKPVRVYPAIAPLRRLPRPLRTQTSVGNYVAPTFGEGLEPGEIRLFAPGDRVRHVNWRASLRLGKLYVTQHHQERNADIILLLDTLSQVGLPRSMSLDLCVRAATSLAWSYLSQKDRVGLVEYGGVIHWVKPGSGRAQFERLLDALLEADVVFTYVAKDLALVPPRVLSPRALVIALSPLLDERFIRAAVNLSGRGFDLVVLSPSPIDLTRAAEGDSPLVDAACRLWAVERRLRISELRQRGLRVLEWHPNEPIEVVLAGLGRQRRAMVMAS
jgi:uncharacterized protein (DUF58 family)